MVPAAQGSAGLYTVPWQGWRGTRGSGFCTQWSICLLRWLGLGNQALPFPSTRFLNPRRILTTPEDAERQAGIWGSTAGSWKPILSLQCFALNALQDSVTSGKQRRTFLIWLLTEKWTCPSGKPMDHNNDQPAKTLSVLQQWYPSIQGVTGSW